MVDSKHQWKAWIYLSPAIVLLLIFTVWPIINTVSIAFMEGYNALEILYGATFEFGFGNFVAVLTASDFITCLTNTMLLLKHVGTEGVHYDPTDIYLDGCTFPADGTWPLVRVEGDRTGRISTWGSCVTGQGYDPIVPPCIGIGTNDIGLRHGEWVRKRPVK
jgi:hypothetical protein